MRTPSVNTALQISFSRQRLTKYLAVSNDDIDIALKLYEENTRLSEAFYTPLQCLEICLRNRVHQNLSGRHGSDWFSNGSVQLSAISQQMVADALRDLRNPAVVDPGAVVAELKFAFWVGLLGPHYAPTLWRQSLHQVFRAAGGQRRDVVHQRFNAIRRFRNRIMHHEPIFDKPLLQIHGEIIEAIDWMCRETSDWGAHHSRLEYVLANPA